MNQLALVSVVAGAVIIALLRVLGVIGALFGAFLIYLGIGVF